MPREDIFDEHAKSPDAVRSLESTHCRQEVEGEATNSRGRVISPIDSFSL